jgi:DNA mismatch repair protein MutL
MMELIHLSPYFFNNKNEFNMPKIKQLSPHEAQKIAAGEVVDRPANIVKELVENSIDAGATRITIYVEDGGKQLIRIVDNGCGMDVADAQICFDRHATSKITRVDQLESINTFGFRGEALASIASVSKITLLTKEEESLESVQVRIEANHIEEMNSAACATGTDISVRDLFFNVPARKKFLKATATEWRAIQLLFNAFCFDYPHIHFSLFTEGKQVHNCPVTQDLKSRALQVFEPIAHKHMLDVAIVDKEITIAGIISDHQHYRYDRSGIYLFVNKRWVKNQHLSSALIKGYANVIPNGRYPIAAISITVPAVSVDINIHPRKEEVKFLHPRRVEQALQQAVKAALEQNVSNHIGKEVMFREVNSSTYARQNSDFSPFDFDAFLKRDAFTSSSIDSAGDHSKENNEFIPAPFDTFLQAKTLRASGMGTSAQEESKQGFLTEEHFFSPFALSASEGSVSKGPNINTSDSSNSTLEAIAFAAPQNYRIIGQYNQTYLLIEQPEGLFLVDQHAAHERILYELFSERFADVATMQLLFPQVIMLSRQDIEIITPHLGIFAANGIIIEQCASDQLMVQSLPVHLKDQSLTDLVKEVISWIAECSTLDTHAFKKAINHKLQAQMACKAAVKAGDTLTQEKMEQLLSDLMVTANRFSCPHGRPTGWLLSLSEIEKKFKRRL